MTSIRPESMQNVVDAVLTHAPVIAHGGRTKEPLIGDDSATKRLDMTGLTGVIEYDPAEYTFTALAGTSLREITSLLAQNGQYMPFDPPLVDEGATIGGTVAAGVNGAGRLRYGGVRDFIIGARFVDGTGRVVRGGGKVVKNAAGFDLPRLLVGSMGRLGVLVEVTFKVFPAPPAWRTLRIACRAVDDAVSCMAALTRQPFELDALELEPPATLLVRVAGPAASLDAHAARVGKHTFRPYDVLPAEAAAQAWRAHGSFTWCDSDHWLIKVPLTLRRLSALDRELEQQDVARRYGAAGNVAWIAWPAHRPLAELDLVGNNGIVVRGPSLSGASPWLGPSPERAAPFAHRIKHALDPAARLPALVDATSQ